MNQPPPHHPSSPKENCPRTRLAQTALAAIDRCECGMLQLHLGALTLRLDAGAMAELAETLQLAVTTHRQLEASPDLSVFGAPRDRGEA